MDTVTIPGVPSAKIRRGFASMTPERQREVASNGGKKSHANGRAHKWTSEEASAAGRIGGKVSRKLKHPEGAVPQS